MERIFIHLLMLASGLLFACGGSEKAADKIIVGVLAPFDRNYGVVEGAILAIEELNAAGGIVLDGRKRTFELITEDTENRPEMALSKALKLINRDRAAVLVGLPRSHTAIPVARIAERNGVPLISTNSTHPETTAGKRYVFRMSFLDDFQGRALAEHAYHDLGVRRVAALIDAAGVYSSHIQDIFGRAFEALGGEVVAVESFTEDNLVVTEQLLRIKAAGAEALFMPNFSEFVAYHVRQARRLGVTATFLGADTWSNEIDPQDCPEIIGSYFIDIWAPSRAEKATRTFIANYRLRFGADPVASAALTYDAVSMIAQAIRDRGAADPGSIRAGLTHLEHEGVSGRIAFRGSGDPERSVFIRKIGEGGKKILHKEIRPPSGRP